MARSFPTKRFALGLVLLLVWLTVKIVTVSWSVANLNHHAGEVSDTHTVLMSLERLLGKLRSVESGQRGYLLTGDASYLDHFEEDVRLIRERLGRLTDQTLPDPDQATRLVKVRGLVEDKLAELHQTVGLYREGRGHEALAIVQTDVGREYMVGLRTLIDEMETAELWALAARSDAVRRAYWVAILLEVAGSLVTLGLALLIISMLRSHMRREQESGDTLEAERQLLATTLNSIGDAVVICDPQGRVTFKNPVSEVITGWSKRDCVGRPLDEVLDLEDDRTGDAVADPLAWTLATSRRAEIPPGTTLIAADGTRRAIDFFAAPIRGDDRRNGGSVLVFRDVTARQEAQKKLRQSEQHFRGLSNAIPVMAWIADEAGSIQWYNDVWYDFTGAARGESDGLGWKPYMDEGEADRILKSYFAAIRTQDVWEDTLRIRRYDGDVHTFLIRAVRVRDEVIGEVNWFGANTDITDQVEMQEKLRTADAAKDEFLAMLGHELRNPLAAISYGVTLLNKMSDTEETAPIREIVATQTRHMSRLVDDLLDVSRIMRGKVSVKREPIDLRNAVRDALGTVAPEVDGGGFDLDVQLGDEPVVVDGDRERLTQVVTNLLNNALRYSPQRTRVEVIVTRGEDEAVLAVCDRGMGIESEMLGRVFELFQQGERPLDRKAGGLGVGLTVARRIIEMHDGSIGVYSAGADRGSTFTIHLPLHKEAPVENFVG